MRQFSETLPTLRETGSSRSDPAASMPNGSFEPGTILKALNARSAHHATDAPAPTNGAGASSSARLNPFDPSHLPRKSATDVTAGRFKKQLVAAIEPFDKPVARPSHADTKAAEATAPPKPAVPEPTVEEVRAEERRKFEATLAAERKRWAEDIGEKLSTQLDQAFVDLHNRLADAITLALSPVLEEAMRTKSVGRFSASLERLMGRAEGSTIEPITISGPQSLLNALTAVRSGDTAGLKLVASNDGELVANVNETTLRTTIKAWATTLAAATGPRHGKE